jgi:hypothetical protein
MDKLEIEELLAKYGLNEETIGEIMASGEGESIAFNPEAMATILIIGFSAYQAKRAFGGGKKDPGTRPGGHLPSDATFGPGPVVGPGPNIPDPGAGVSFPGQGPSGHLPPKLGPPLQPAQPITPVRPALPPQGLQPPMKNPNDPFNPVKQPDQPNQDIDNKYSDKLPGGTATMPQNPSDPSAPQNPQNPPNPPDPSANQNADDPQNPPQGRNPPNGDPSPNPNPPPTDVSPTNPNNPDKKKDDDDDRPKPPREYDEPIPDEDVKTEGGLQKIKKPKEPLLWRPEVIKLNDEDTAKMLEQPVETEIDKKLFNDFDNERNTDDTYDSANPFFTMQQQDYDLKYTRSVQDHVTNPMDFEPNCSNRGDEVVTLKRDKTNDDAFFGNEQTKDSMNKYKREHTFAYLRSFKKKNMYKEKTSKLIESQKLHIDLERNLEIGGAIPFFETIPIIKPNIDFNDIFINKFSF